MPINLYAACWNEERMIPFFLRHERLGQLALNLHYPKSPFP